MAGVRMVTGWLERGHLSNNQGLARSKPRNLSSKEGHGRFGHNHGWLQVGQKVVTCSVTQIRAITSLEFNQKESEWRRSEEGLALNSQLFKAANQLQVVI